MSQIAQVFISTRRIKTREAYSHNYASATLQQSQLYLVFCNDDFKVTLHLRIA